MSNSREDSPDWLRSFQPPTQSAIELSSGSESPLDHSPVSDNEDDVNLSKLFKKEATQSSDINDNDDEREPVAKKAVKGKSPKKNEKVKQTPERKRKNNEDSKKEGGEEGQRKGCQQEKYTGEEWKVSYVNLRLETSTEDMNAFIRPRKPNGHDSVTKDLYFTLSWLIAFFHFEQNHSILSLSSDSESSPDASPLKKNKAIKKELPAKTKDLATENIKIMDDIPSDHDGKSPKDQAPKVEYPIEKLEEEDEKTSKKTNINSSINGENDTDNNAVKEDISGKHLGPRVSSSRLPLLLSDKVQRSKALVECEGDSIDLSGDVGSVGRVSFGQSEAKIEAIMNDYIQLKPLSNVYEAETMVEGTLDGFSFDSEDEADKATAQADQQEAAEEQADGKTKRKADKTSGAAKKKGKPAGGKPPKKVKKKPQVTKKSKTKK
ncbi:hypothetical protein BUALT_Bualt06G0142100 [Buddleja alternifolia]|uniref:DNA-binding protein BIN4 n=1 Tax=Buddleja alternifolia TaxID=168488 RepID=A0AAV6XJD8_9LAMI|nr:hypothetical protein BUALT_Bualt06G0142100 [Buddleja alternifolia]